ncbi:MAG: carbohydrate ABC transporter permease, partial [Ruthenibacterium sp.]
AAAIYSFMTAWNNYLWPLIVLQTDATKTMTLMISSLSTSSYVADYGMQMMALVIATIPMMILFLVMQRSFVEGMTGSVKG